MIDSGAFTKKVNRKNNKFDFVTLENYIKFCHLLKSVKFKYPIKYIHFDYMDRTNPNYITISNKNFDIMTQNGLHPIPCFRANDSFKTLDKWLNTEKLISIGGLVRLKNKNTFLNALFKRYKNHMKRFHLLGVGNYQTIKRLKPYSCDSTALINPQHYYSFLNMQQKELKKSIRIKNIIGPRKYVQFIQVLKQDKLPSKNSINCEILRVIITNNFLQQLTMMFLLQHTKIYTATSADHIPKNYNENFVKLYGDY